MADGLLINHNHKQSSTGCLDQGSFHSLQFPLKGFFSLFLLLIFSFQFSHQQLWNIAIPFPPYPPSSMFIFFFLVFPPVDILYNHFLLVTGKRKIAWAKCWDVWSSGPHGSPQVGPSLCCKNEVILFFLLFRQISSEVRAEDPKPSVFFFYFRAIITSPSNVFQAHLSGEELLHSVWKGRDPDPNMSQTLTLFLANPC